MLHAKESAVPLCLLGIKNHELEFFGEPARLGRVAVDDSTSLPPAIARVAMPRPMLPASMMVTFIGSSSVPG
jgi:hypothetical protein